MIRLTLIVKNTYFIVRPVDRDVIDILNTINRPLITYKFIYDRIRRKNIRVNDMSYFVANRNTGEYRYNINLLKRFMSYLRSAGYDRSEIQLISKTVYRSKSLLLQYNKEYQPREKQMKYVEAILNHSSKSVLVDLQTGQGKGVISVYTAVKTNMRTAILVLPKYIDKWYLELQEYTDIDTSEIAIIKGNSSLKKLMKSNDDYKIIILSIPTVASYIKDAIKNPENYTIQPDDFVEDIGIGVIINDEAHQHFHAVHNIMLYFNPMLLIGLSATLDSNDGSIRNIYEVMYPPANRINNIIAYNKYIIVKAITYRLQNVKRVMFKGPQGYSQILYEQSILRNSALRKDYIDMISYYVKYQYITRMRKGERCLIFAGSIVMCKMLANHFDKLYPELIVNKYVEDDEYSNLINSDICVSTVLSAGTAVDISNLITVVQTISIGSLQANVQSMGRLREIKDRDVRFVYMYCKDIPNHVRLNDARMKVLGPKSKEYYYMEYPKILNIY